ncbi:MAG: hypothetical protein FJ280_07315 [Planctomycetes bacterium]|nr:hypothetical protein [Planctomycetota bacterium]
MDHTRPISVLGTTALLLLAASPFAWGDAANKPPRAEAGLPRYAAKAPVRLDGSGSYDPDHSGPLTYAWTQASGPPLVITGADTATPAVSGFVQTAEIQECVFELVVSDGELRSAPDTVSTIIVPLYGPDALGLERPPFDANKPTVILFRGGDCVNGNLGRPWDVPDWIGRANIIDFPSGYTPDSYTVPLTYYKYADMLIAYLSSVAPEYRQPIQIIGVSTGGMPAIDVALRLNTIYRDPRYNANRVTYCDARCRDKTTQLALVDRLVANSVEGEPCWVDSYDSTGPWPNALSVYCPLVPHAKAGNWYRESLVSADMGKFNDGVVAGAYWSVVGPGKNLQLAPAPGRQIYSFQWSGSSTSGRMEFYHESSYPGRLPQPITLTGPAEGAAVGAGGAVLSCRNSQNAVGYQLLFGRDPFHLTYLAWEGATPPNDVVTVFPFPKTWWTIKARDLYGSTIHADPVCLTAENVVPQTIENSGTSQTYAAIQEAINAAHEGDQIVLAPGVWQYLGNLDFKGKGLTLRSADPNDARVVGATVLCGDGRGPVVTLSSGPDRPPTLEGLTIAGGTVGISCRDAAPTIRRCTVGSDGPVAIEFWPAHEPRLIDCTLFGHVTKRDVDTSNIHATYEWR